MKLTANRVNFVSKTLMQALENDEGLEEGEHFIVFGNSGRGINSWYMYYYLSYKPLYITWCSSYGGTSQNKNFLFQN
jgi:hypothetical protein